MTASFAAGAPVTLDRTESIADGLLSLRPGELTFAHLQRFLDAIVTVDEAAIADAVRWLFGEARLVVEPSGAVGVAAALAAAASVEHGLDGERAGEVSRGAPGGTGPVVAVLSGGNVDPERYIACLRPISPEPRP
jgi:threonine dehydratase